MTARRLIYTIAFVLCTVTLTLQGGFAVAEALSR
jgi:hypothetical protein